MLFRSVAPASSIILALLVVFFYVRPTYEAIGLVQTEIEDKQTALDDATEFNNKLSSLVSRRSSLTATQLDRLEAVVPDDVNIVKTIVDLESVAKEQGLLFGNIQINDKFQQVNPSLDKPDGGVTTVVTEADFITVEIGFGVIGTYSQFRNFLATLESSLTLVDVSSISLTVVEGELQQFGVVITRKSLQPMTI